MIVSMAKGLSEYRTEDAPEIKISEVNRAIDCWMISKEPIELNFGPYISPDTLNRILHPVFSRYGFDWISGLSIKHQSDVDDFCMSVSSFFKFKIQDTTARNV